MVGSTFDRDCQPMVELQPGRNSSFAPPTVVVGARYKTCNGQELCQTPVGYIVHGLLDCTIANLMLTIRTDPLQTDLM